MQNKDNLILQMKDMLLSFSPFIQVLLKEALKSRYKMLA